MTGYYVAESAAHDPRVAAVATVSGPFRLDWQACPLPVVDGGRDVIPGVTNGEPPARLAPRGEHLLGNALADWMPRTADWISATLADSQAARRLP